MMRMKCTRRDGMEEMGPCRRDDDVLYCVCESKHHGVTVNWKCSTIKSFRE
jgi:hypothetical protein